ncbi:hypothetical protein L6164_037687 [Bauhinia variegata]|uniref:Uncharacterized protein n=1 Tax=Bauhinia variegata TaxID=167791 RepID=A0ACB9KLK1_BAUVA|nr:hypothetical protein L6164_037687 [Bauhinia variegata]
MSTSLPNLTFFTRHNRNFAISTENLGFWKSFISVFGAMQASYLRFQTRSASASSQPLAEEVRGNDVKDNPVSGDAIRHKFLTFYASSGLKVLPSSSLVPDDPTVLLTIARMLQFKPIFLGKVPRQVPCATTVQRGYADTDLDDDTRFIEFHYLVFMQYNKTDDGSLEPLKQKNIDTGLGLERVACILQKVPNNYKLT